MALVHDFVVVNEKFTIEEVSGYTNTVKIPDALIQSFADSFNWVITYWNNKYEKAGLNYYGYTIIKGLDIEKLKVIVECWLKLFENATDSFYIKGNYLYNEDDYERIELSKQEVLTTLENLQEICIQAIEENKLLLHMGI